MANDSLPVIDISPFLDGSGGSDGVVAQTHSACLNTGFFIVTGHGVDPAVAARLYDRARAFFDQSDAEKRALFGQAPQIAGLDFAPLLKEALAATQGVSSPGDIKESVNFGPRLAGGPWPVSPQGMREAFLAYFVEMEKLAHVMRRIFCVAIGLEHDYFEPYFASHLSALRVINYPAQSTAPLPGQLRAGAHTDYGFMTILRSEASAGGLQVQRRDGMWIDAPAVDNAFVVNIADAFMRWTNDTWVSTPHRVANPPAQARGSARRQSIAFFVNPSKDAPIECLKAFCAEGNPPKYAGVTFGEYIDLKTKQAFAHA